MVLESVAYLVAPDVGGTSNIDHYHRSRKLGHSGSCARMYELHTPLVVYTCVVECLADWLLGCLQEKERMHAKFVELSLKPRVAGYL